MPHPCSQSSAHPHRALTCYDVLCAIFEQLAASEQFWYDYDVSIGDANCWYARRTDSLRRSTLARCARVCTAFLEPAISVLWRDIDSLEPLIAISATQCTSPSLMSHVSQSI